MVAVSVVGIAVLAWIGASGKIGSAGDNPEEFWILVGLVVLGELLPISVARKNEEEEISTSTIFAFALLLTGGLAAAVLALALAGLCAYYFRSRSLLRSSFSVAHYTLAITAAAGVLELLSDVPHENAPYFTAAELPAILLAIAIFYVINNSSSALVTALDQTDSKWAHLRNDLAFRAGPVGASLALSPIVVVAADYSLALIPLLVLPIAALYTGGRQAAMSEYQALHDSLTHLPNRALFLDRLRQSLLVGGREDFEVAVMVMDLDGFKEINDSLGHHNGDLLLRQIGPRLRSVLRESDTIARLGGDEFAVLLPSITDKPSAVQVAEKMRRALELPFALHGLRLNMEASIGMAFYPDHGESAERLLQRADVAMYAAKQMRSGYAIYSADQDQNTPSRLALIGELRRALDEEEIQLYYQPKAHLESGEVQGVEALVRWHHPDRGLVPPGEFVPITEQTGLILPFTLYVLEGAIKQTRSWLEAGLELTTAVNLSTRNLLELELPEQIAALLAKWDVPARQLELEITESTIMSDPMRALTVLDRLSEMGVGIAIDDFGTGYSSLAYLKRLPVSEIKIDRSFVSNMIEDENDAVIVRSTIDLGRNLGLQVVAEGVETEAEWDALTELGCDYAQGHYVSPAVSAGELMQWLRARGPHTAPQQSNVRDLHG
jgi:diguanylate cyclase (GGDEF)-like protein